MTRRRVLAAVGALWLGIGGFGVYSYAHDYYRYRGFGRPADPAGVAAGRLVKVDFRSPAFGGRIRSYDVYLPPGYATAAAAGRRFGVLYLLHGSPGWPRLFVDAGALGVAMDTLLARHRMAPLLVVMPDGRDGTFRSATEWADTRHGPYERFVSDVVAAVDRRWPTIADRSHRVIAGNSEGAYAAVNIALRQLPTFAAAEAWSGYYRQTPTGPFKHEPRSLLRANSPMDYVRSRQAQIARYPLRAFLYSGRSDSDVRQLAPFAARLRAAGAKVQTAVYPGRHDWKLWRAQTPHMLRWASARVGAPR